MLPPKNRNGKGSIWLNLERMGFQAGCEKFGKVQFNSNVNQSSMWLSGWDGTGRGRFSEGVARQSCASSKKKRNLGESSRVLSPSCWADFKPSGMPFSVRMVLCIRVSIGNQEKGRDLMCLRQNNDFLQPSLQIQCGGGHNARERMARNRMTVSLYEPSNVRIAERNPRIHAVRHVCFDFSVVCLHAQRVNYSGADTWPI